MLDKLMRRVSRIPDLSTLNVLAPSAASLLTPESQQGFLAAQNLAETGAREIAGFIREGWTEVQAATMLNTWLMDHHVGDFFHYSYAWFGERTRFDGINRRRYHEFMPTDRTIRPGEPFILDTAPIFRGYMCDIGYSGCLGENPAWSAAQSFLKQLRHELICLFQSSPTGGVIWEKVNERIESAGYDNTHALYPFSVLGHRIYRAQSQSHSHQLHLANFGWQSYWSILSRGVFGQLLNRQFEGDLTGLWAIEPHIGGEGFGAKFEEILVVENRDRVYWLNSREAAK